MIGGALLVVFGQHYQVFTDVFLLGKKFYNSAKETFSVF